ncbi:hypothetical protein [Marinomonas transparens]|uniref:PhoD-like phosphatase metallophosphatase domain-containing protein n=1 Tax=Marinomonas transparens TaxID=2795388 RepID=A0A934MZ91_9GAMM|nr:hypothetical protein [Marinomonas transparens]MBJ7537295.1 hypothetical protein [Marinomonas transparens]
MADTTQEYQTDTSKWAIAVHRVTSTSVEIWVGSLYTTLIKPKMARVCLLVNGEVIQTKDITTSDWKRPFRNTTQRFVSLQTFDDIQPNTAYTVRFERYISPEEETLPVGWVHLRNAYFNTLPESISSESSFTIGLASCFYPHRDGGRAAEAYQALYERGDDEVKPDITFLTGDQVYLDIGFDSLSRDPDEIRQRIGDDYATNWQLLGGILNRGATWMLPDDHEFWNDYPFHDSLIPQLLALKLKGVRETWTKAAKDAVKNIQRSPRVETFTIGNDLSFCLADLRSYRSKNTFLPHATFKQLTNWAESLTSPGVLVIPQPLIVNINKTERNLLSYKAQYKRLLEALGSSGQNIVVLSGDVHFGRIASCPIGEKGATLTEIISSPMSNLTYLNGIATTGPEFSPEQFPAVDFLPTGWQQQAVTYDKNFAISTKKGFLFSAYPKERTREHFMTIGFKKVDQKLQMTVNAWRIRERDPASYLPLSDFEQAYQVLLTK